MSDSLELEKYIIEAKKSIATCLRGEDNNSSIKIYYYKSITDHTKQVLGSRASGVDSVIKVIDELLAHKAIMLVGYISAKDKALLKRNGLNEFEHFVKEEYALKPMAIFYGNCHMSKIKQYLINQRNFRDCYCVYPLLEIYAINDASYFDKKLFCWCDLFIHQAIRTGNKYGEAYASKSLIDLLREDARVIAVPNTYHLPMHIYSQYDEKEELVFPVFHRTVFFRDSVLDDLCIMDRCNVNKIVNDYLSDRIVLDADEIKEKYEKFNSTVIKRENEWDIKVSKYIEETFRTQRLFYDPNHPSGSFLIWICKQLMHQLDIEQTSFGENVDEYMNMDQYEMPITEAVKKALGIGFEISEKMRCHTLNTLTKRPIEKKEYVRQYLALKYQDKELPFLWRARCLAYMIVNYSVPVLKQVVYTCGSIVLSDKIKRKIKQVFMRKKYEH